MAVTVETLYTTVDGFEIAYQVHGTGSVDLLMIDEWLRCCEADWDDPWKARMLERNGRFARVIRYDGRGTGMSDPVPLGTAPGLDAWMRDAIAVLDAVGSAQCAVYGNAYGGPIAIRIAARHPDRVRALVLNNTLARLRKAPDYPIGLPDDLVEAGFAFISDGWGRGVMLDVSGVGHDDPTREWAARLERLIASPGSARALTYAFGEVDVREDLRAISAPTLVLHTENPMISSAHGRALADGVAGAIFEEEGPDDWIWPIETDNDPPHIARIAEFLTGVRHDADPDRVFATVLVTDIVGSTSTAVTLGDRKWRLLINAHDAETRRQVKRSGGQIATMTGDGVVAIFSTPTLALGCAEALREALSEHDIAVRIGIHAAEIELRDEQIGGIGVHIAARVNALAESGEILVTNTVRDLVTGSGRTFTERGHHSLKGVPGEWAILAAES